MSFASLSFEGDNLCVGDSGVPAWKADDRPIPRCDSSPPVEVDTDGNSDLGKEASAIAYGVDPYKAEQRI